jgi:sugar (pentulose or hexulose) kinase
LLLVEKMRNRLVLAAGWWLWQAKAVVGGGDVAATAVATGVVGQQPRLEHQHVGRRF